MVTSRCAADQMEEDVQDLGLERHRGAIAAQLVASGVDLVPVEAEDHGASSAGPSLDHLRVHLFGQQYRRFAGGELLHLAEAPLDVARLRGGLAELVRGLVELLLHAVQQVAELAELGLHRAEQLPDLLERFWMASVRKPICRS